MSTTTDNKTCKQRLLDAKTPQERQAVLDTMPHQVGFAKPPTHSRFKPGNSMAKGRRKGCKNTATLIEEEFSALLQLTENGKPRKFSRRQVMIRQLANRGSKGDVKAINACFDLERKYGVHERALAAEAMPSTGKPQWHDGVELSRLSHEEQIEFRDLALVMEREGSLALAPTAYSRLQELVRKARSEEVPEAKTEEVTMS